MKNRTLSFDEESKARYEDAYYCEDCNWIGCKCPPFPSQSQPKTTNPKQPNKQESKQ